MTVKQISDTTGRHPHTVRTAIKALGFPLGHGKNHVMNYDEEQTLEIIAKIERVSKYVKKSTKEVSK